MTAPELQPLQPLEPLHKTDLSRAQSTGTILRIIGLYLFVVFFGAAIFSPYLYEAAQWLAYRYEGFASLARHPFHRYVNRCLIGLALLGLWPFIQALRIPSWSALGVRGTLRHWGEALEGAAWGFGTLALAAALAVGFGARALDLDHTQAAWIKHLRNAGLAALLVGFIEELLFRGALFGSLRRAGSFVQAAFLSSALYALLHFFERPQNPGRIEWNSGLLILGEMMRGFTDWDALWPAFFNLALVGWILALCYERTGSILFSVGLHAGLIFWVKSFGFLTRAAPDTQVASHFWGSNKLVDGWAAGILLLLLAFALRRLLPRRQPPDDES